MDELLKLKAENQKLRREQDLMFLLLEVIMIAVERKMDSKSVNSEQNVNQSVSDRDNQVGMLLKGIRESGENSLPDRLLAFFETFDSGK